MRNGPAYIQFYPTLRCNRSCEFCFNKDMPFMSDMPFDQFQKMLRAVKPAGVETIDIMGGEPTMHPDILRIIGEANREGLCANISSNGTNLARLEEILALGNHITVGVSINDRETLGTLRKFVKQHRPVVKTVFRPGMVPGMIDDILRLLPKKFYLIYCDAMDRQNLEAAIPFYRFMRTVEQRWSAANMGTVFCSGFLPDVDNYPELFRARCPAGSTKLGVMPDGSVYPCNLFFGRKEYLLGNILTDPFESIWSHAALVFFRSFTANTCPRTSCTLHSECHGGCPAHSLIHGGALAAPEPRCGISEI